MSARAVAGVLALTVPVYADKAEDAVLLLDEGVKLYDEGEVQAARDAFLGARDLEPDKPNPYRWLGLADARLGHFADAARELDVFLQKVPPDDARVADARKVRDQCRQQAAAAKAARVTVAGGDGPGKGPLSAPVQILEYSEFECLECARMQPVLKQLLSDYGRKLRIVWKNRPLPRHERGLLAAEAAMAAYDQGRFWLFHDLLFSSPMRIDRPTLELYAREIGLDLPRFRAALDSHQFMERIQHDQEELRRLLPAAGAPVFLVNGKPIPAAAYNLDGFRRAIDAQLAGAPSSQ